MKDDLYKNIRDIPQKLDFDIDSIQNCTLDLLPCQIDLILKSLELHMYTYQFIYPRTNKSKTKEEDLRISLLHDTYEQILDQFVELPRDTRTYEKISKNFKKVA